MNLRNEELVREISRLRGDISELKQKLATLQACRSVETPERVISTPEANFLHGRREADSKTSRSIVLFDIPEFSANNPSARVAQGAVIGLVGFPSKGTCETGAKILLCFLIGLVF